MSGVGGLSEGIFLVEGFGLGGHELGLHGGLVLGVEADRVNTVGASEEFSGGWLNLDVLPSGLLPSAGDELHLLAYTKPMSDTVAIG